jgi:FKBP-type peptidyl-prolyl cis-trans isomerase
MPPHLAYGKKGKKFDIPGCAILVFEIELLGIKSTASAVTKE